MRLTSRLAVLCIGIAIATLSVMSAAALGATGTWNGGAGAAWDTTTTNWLNLTGAPWDLTNGGTNTAVFNTAGATPTVNGTVYANGITFSNAATVSGGTITLAGTLPTITTSANATIGSVLAGSAGLAKAGASTLTLTANNTYTGTTNVNAGSLTLGSAAGSILGSSTINVTAATLSLDNSTTNLNDRIADTATLRLNAASAFSLTGNGATASTTETLGTLAFGGGQSTVTLTGAGASQLQTLATGSVSRSASAVALIRGTSLQTATANATRLTVGGVDGTGLTFVGSGTSSVGTSTAGTDKTLRIVPYLVGDTSASGNGSTFLTYDTDATAFGLRPLASGEYTTLAAGYATPATAENVNAFNGTISTASDVTVNSLRVNTAGALNGSGGKLVVNSGAVLATASGTIGSGFGGLTLGDGTWNEGIVMPTSGNTLTINTPITVTGNGPLTKGGAGTLVLGGSNTIAGGVTVSQGGVQITNANALGAGALTFNVDADTTTAFNMASGGTVANNITINRPGSARTYIFQQRQNDNVTLAGNIIAGVNNVFFNLSGVSSGTITLTGSNTIGGTVVPQGLITMRIGGTNAAGGAVWRPDTTARMILLDGANFRSVIGNSIASFGMETSGTASVSGQFFTRSTVTTTVNTPAGAQLTFTNIGTENGASPGVFTKTGDGTMIVASGPAATYTVNGGVLQVAALSTALSGSTAPNLLVLSGGTLRYTGAATNTVKQFTLGASGGGLDASGSGAVAFTSGSAVSFTGSGNRTLTLSGVNTGNNVLAAVIGDNGSDVVSLAKIGAGRWTLTGSNGYTGGTQIAAGILIFGSVNALGTGTISFTGSATLQAGAEGTLANPISLDSGVTGTFDSNSNANTLSGGIGGQGSLVKASAGTLTLSGSNSFSGGTVVSAGTLLLQSASALGAATGSLAVNGGTLDLNANSVTVGTLSGVSGATITSTGAAALTASSAASSTYGGAMTGAIAFAQAGSGTLTLSASNAYTGGTVISSGRLVLANTSALGSTAGSLAVTEGTLDLNGFSVTVGALSGSSGATITSDAAATLTASSASNSIYAGSITGSAGLTKSGAGALTLSGSSSYVGTTTLSAGQLSINNASAIGTGTLTFNGGNIDNTSLAPVALATSNPQAWNSDFTFVGSSPLDLGTGTATLGANRNVTVTSSTLTVGGGIGGAFSLTKSGGGTLRLSSASSYSGGTVISAGTVVLGNASALGAATGALAVNGGGLDLGGNSVTVGTLSGSSGATITSVVAATLTGSSASSSTYAGSITGAVALAKAGGGTLTLSGSSSYSGGTTLTGGGLTIANANALGMGGLTFNVDADTSTYFSLPASGTIANTITINKPGVNRTYYFWQNQASDVGLSGNITVASGNGLQFRLNGPSSGTFTLTGSNTFGGDVYSGANVTFRIGGTNAAGGVVWRPDLTTKMVLLDGANFRSIVGNAIASYGMETSGTATVSNMVFNRNTANVLVNLPAGARLQFTGQIFPENGSTTGAFTKTGAGTWVVSNAGNGAFTYNVNEGVLQIPTFAALGGSTTASLLVLNGGTLQYAGGATTTAKQFTLEANGGSLDASGSGTVAFTSTAAVSFAGSGARALTLTGTNTGDNTVAAAIGDNAGDVISLAKTGAGTWVLSGSNTYTGATTVSAGRLRAGGNASLSANSAFTVASGAVLGLNGSAASIGSLAGAGTIENGHASTVAALAVGGDNTSTTFSGAIQNGAAAALGLTKVGSGRLTLTAANGYTGATSITAGVLEIGSAGSINSTSGLTVNGSTAEFKYNAATAFTQPLALTQGTISGTGTIGAAVDFAGGDYLSPGNSPGTQSYTNQLTWSPLGTYEWELNALMGTAGTNWDFVNVSSGTFNLSGLSAAPGNQFVLDLITLDAGNLAGPLAIPFDGGSYTLPIASYNPANFLLPTGFSNTAGANLTSLFTINLGNWQDDQPQIGNVSVKINSTATGIDLVIVPEPGALVFAGIGLAMAGWAVRNRRRAAP